MIIGEFDGKLRTRIPAPPGVELADPAWVDSTIYCLAVNDEGYSIWRRDESQWTCVLEPTLQEIENLEGENQVLDFVSDRNGVKELYRYDPATGRAWQLTNSRYGGTDYFWHDGELWFNSITPEGSAIFKATLQAVDNSHAFRGVRPGEEGDDDVMAPGERSADGLESHPAHDDGVPGGLLPEILHIAREVPQQGVLAADGVVVGDGDDEALFHG